MGKTKLNLKGKVFGRLTVLEFSHINKDGRAVWLCGCRCGWYSKVDSSTLVRDTGNARSCGFCKPDVRWPSEYITWMSMRGRCNNPNDTNYENYGGRGIKVCERWDDFFNFLEDVGMKEHPELTLDRIENNGNYEPGNVRWATKYTQARNKRPHIITAAQYEKIKHLL